MRCAAGRGIARGRARLWRETRLARRSWSFCARGLTGLPLPPVVLALVAGFAATGPLSAGFAAAIDSRLVGAWTSSAADCQKLFERRGGELAYRQPVDKFAQAFIIEPGQIRLPTGICRVAGVAHDKDGVAVSLDCHDSISFQSETVHFKIHSGAEIVYSPTGGPSPSLDTTYQKCRL